MRRSLARHVPTLLPLFLLASLIACGRSALPGSIATAPPPAEPVPVPEPAVFDRIAPDPTAAGPYTATAQEYDFGRITVRDEVSGGTYESDVHGVAWMPGGLAAGQRVPVLVWLHGRHQTCQTSIGALPLLVVGDDDCPVGLIVVERSPGFRGYDAAAQMLATQGYLVLSIDLNDVNDNDNSAPTDRGALARAQLALEHLDRFRAIDAAGGSGFDALQGHLDFSHVGLMGHSRGGIGIIKTAQENALRPAETRYGIVAIFGLATDTGGLNIGEAALDLEPDIAWAGAHGWCDGDAPDFFSQFYYDKNRLREDQTAPRFLFVPMGANHNNYNTEWASGDDWSNASDTHCGSSGPRDDTAAQQAQLKFFLGSFFRYFVGGESAYAPLWQGRTGMPAALCPDGQPGCTDRFPAIRLPPPAQRLVIDAMDAERALTRNALGGSTLLSGFDTSAICTPDTGGNDPPSGGHGCPADPTFSRIPQLALDWSVAGARYRTDFMPQDVFAHRYLSLRIGLNGDGSNPASGQDFGIVLRDAAGRSARLEASQWSAALFVPPGSAYASGGSRRTLLFGIELPLAAFAGVDLHSVSGIELVFDKTATGSVQIADLMFQRE